MLEPAMPMMMLATIRMALAAKASSINPAQAPQAIAARQPVNVTVKDKQVLHRVCKSRGP